MTGLDEQLKRYVTRRADGVSPSDADLLVTRALARPVSNTPWTRHGRNVAAAIALSVLLVAGGVILEGQLIGRHTGAPTSSAGPLPTIPNEIVRLDDASQAGEFVTPFRLKDAKILPPTYRWILPQNRALVLSPSGDCSSVTVHVVDAATSQDVRPPVTLPDCYGNPVVLPGTQVLLAHEHVEGQRGQSLGITAYDWSSGRVVRNYPDVAMGVSGGLLSSDASLLYTLNPSAPNGGTLDITDLTTGASVARLTVPIVEVGLNAGGIALSPDGRTLYINEGIRLRTFDARTGKAGVVLNFEEARPSPAAWLPGWLWRWPSSITAEAKEGFEAGHGIAVDPTGRWVAAISIDDASVAGIWIFDRSGSGQAPRHLPVPSKSRQSGFRGVAFSLDGSVLYAVYVEAQQGGIDVVDPGTGRFRALNNPRFSDLIGIAGVYPAS
jgi:hypothetical protein